MDRKLTGVPAGLVEETRAMVRMRDFLVKECGLKEAERMGERELRELLGCLNYSAKCNE